MKENKELNERIYAIGKWAAKNPKRVAFVVCGEITDNGVETSNSLVGRSGRIARALFGNAMEDKSFKTVIELAALLCRETSADDKTGDGKSDFLDELIGLLDAIKDKIKND